MVSKQHDPFTARLINQLRYWNKWLLVK